MNKLYSMPTDGPTIPGDEFLNRVTFEWAPVPPESIGKAIDDAIIRRPVSVELRPVGDVVDAVGQLEATVAETGRIAQELGKLLGSVRNVAAV